MDFATVFSTFNQTEAQLVRSRLEAAEFYHLVATQLSTLSIDGYALAAGGIHVQVPEAGAADAREFLNAPPAG